MPNQRKKGKCQVCVWLDAKQVRELDRLARAMAERNRSSALKKAIEKASQS